MNGKAVFAFIVGVAVGATAVWKYAKQKFERIADEEIASVKEAFSERYQKYNYTADKAQNESDVQSDSANQLTKTIRNYNKAAAEYNPTENETEGPYIITPEEYGTKDGYMAASFTYFEDGVVTDEMDNIVEDVDEALGTDFVNHFDEYEEDSVFIRNEERHCDYEVLRDYRNYSDVPHTEV